MATSEVTIQMDQNTLIALANGGFQLYGYTAVECSDRAGLPAVWLGTKNFSLTTRVAVPASYDAFTAPAMSLAPGITLRASFEVPISTGQILEVNQAGGTGSVKSGGEPGTVTILNQTETQYTCGLMQNGESGGQVAAAPICGFDLYGGGIQLITPLQKVLFLFSSVVAAPGTMVELSKGPGILIDLTDNDSPTIQFGINQGWSWGGYAWAQTVAANTDLRPVLIQYSVALASLSTRLKERVLSKAL
jgi:hypothetical protein